MALQRGMRAADAVERGDLGDDVAGRVRSRGRGSRTSPNRDIPRGPAAPRPRRARSRNRRPTGRTGSRPARRGSGSRRGPRSAGRYGLMSGVLTKKFGRKNSATSVVRQLGQIVGELLLGVAPGEVGVGLREADLGQPVHHLRPREGLGQEDHVGMARRGRRRSSIPRTAAAWCADCRRGRSCTPSPTQNSTMSRSATHRPGIAPSA